MQNKKKPHTVYVKIVPKKLTGGSENLSVSFRSTLNIYTLHTLTIESSANFLFIPYPNTYKNYTMLTLLKKTLFILLVTIQC